MKESFSEIAHTSLCACIFLEVYGLSMHFKFQQCGGVQQSLLPIPSTSELANQIFANGGVE